MPNWCENDLHCFGPAKDIRRMVKFMKTKDNPFDFLKAVPYPKERQRLDDMYSKRSKFNCRCMPAKSGDSYNWCINNWGTKWNSCETSVHMSAESNGTKEVIYEFQTAWSPSTPVTCALSKLFPTIEFTHHYSEGGMAFEGEEVWKNGKGTEIPKKMWSMDHGVA